MLTKYSSLEYLLIDLSNHFGNDKLLYEERIAWVDEHHDTLEDYVDTADKPEMYLAAVLALRAVERGEETGHMVEFDAAASGPAIMGAIVGCFITAQTTGLIGNKRGDIYTAVTQAASRICSSEIKVERDVIKYAIMPWGFGSEKKPKEFLGEGTPEYNAFFKGIEEVAPGFYNLRNYLTNTWVPYTLAHSWYMPDGYYAHIPVMVPKESRIKIQELGKEMDINYLHSVNCGVKDGLSNCANTIHAIDGCIVREMGRRCNYDQMQLALAAHVINVTLFRRTSEPTELAWYEELWLESGFLSLVVTDKLNSIGDADSYSTKYLEALAQLIQRTLQYRSFPILFIHDCFKAHPNHMQIVRENYVEIMAEIAESEILSFILSQILDEEVTVEKLSPDLGEHIRHGEYSIC